MAPRLTPRRAAIAGASSAVLLLAGVMLLVLRDEHSTTRVSARGTQVPTTETLVTTWSLPPVTLAPSTTAATPSTTSTSRAPVTATSARPTTASSPTAPPPGEQLESAAGDHRRVAAALADARARWARSKPANGYTWTYDNDCFCYPRKLEVTVDGAGRVTGTRNVAEPGSAVTTPGRTVEAAFDELQGAIDADAASIRVRFDAARGFPSSYFVDRSRQLADEEHGLTVVDFRPRS